MTVKAAYGAGALAESIKAFSFGLFVLFFYTTVLGVPGTLVGIATALGLAWDSVIDPWIGHWSDRSRSRHGRRHSFMFVGAVCMGVSFTAIFNPPAALPVLGLFAWLIVSSVCLRTMTSIFMVPYYALGAELSEDYHERTTVSAWRAGFALAGTIAAALSSFLIFFAGDGTGADPKFARDGYSAMGMGFGAAITLAGLIATFGTRDYRSPAAAAARGRAPFFGGVRAALAHSAFRRLVLSASLFFLASVVNVSLALHYLTYYAKIPTSSAIALFQLAFYVGALAGVPVWLRVAKIVQKHHLFVATTLATATFVTFAYLLVGDGRMFGTGAVIPLAIGNAIAGFFAGALWVLAPSMIADVAGSDSHEGGKRRDGVFFGIYSFGQQSAAGVALLLTGAALDHVAGFVPGAAQQTAATAQRIAVLYALVPAILLSIAALGMVGYDLTRSRVERREQFELTTS